MKVKSKPLIQKVFKARRTLPSVKRYTSSAKQELLLSNISVFMGKYIIKENKT